MNTTLMNDFSSISIPKFQYERGFTQYDSKGFLKQQVKFVNKNSGEFILISIRKKDNLFDICILSDQGHIKDLDSKSFTSLKKVYNFINNYHFNPLQIFDEPLVIHTDYGAKIYQSKSDYALEKFKLKIQSFIQYLR